MKNNKFYRATETGLTFRIKQIEINISFKWFDLWIGLFIDRPHKTVYFLPFPTVVLRFRKIRKPSRLVIAVKTGRLIPSKSINFDDLTDEIKIQIRANFQRTADRSAERIKALIFSGDDLKESSIVIAKREARASAEYYLTADKFEQFKDICDNAFQGSDNQKQKEKERDEPELKEKPEYKLFGDGRKNGKQFASKFPKNFKPLNRRREGETKPTKKK